MRKFSKEILRESLEKSINQPSDWSLPADIFAKWLIEKPEESKKSFDLLHHFLQYEAPDWIVEELPEDIRGTKTWENFFDYLPNAFVEFAEEWVDESERWSYFLFCLEVLREKEEISYEKLARKMDISTRTLIRWLKGEVKPSDMGMKIIRKFLESEKNI